MKKLLATLLLAGLALSACGQTAKKPVSEPAEPAQGTTYQQELADKIQQLKLREDDLKGSSFGAYELVEEINENRYGLGGREIHLQKDDETVFTARYMTLASEEALKENFTAIADASDITRSTEIGDETLTTELNKKITFRKDGIKMDVSLAVGYFAEHSLDELRELAELMVDKV